jgi:hypothetical protein
MLTLGATAADMAVDRVVSRLPPSKSSPTPPAEMAARYGVECAFSIGASG